MLLSIFYAVRILTTKFEGYRHATYQEIVVYTGDLPTRMDFDRLCISVCKMSILAIDRDWKSPSEII